jgi:hypothetical protein
MKVEANENPILIFENFKESVNYILIIQYLNWPYITLY